MTAKDIDLFELNEAFAAVVLRFMEALCVPHDRINVNGGAIAMGHPIGATGAMILGILLDEMERRGVGTGLCIALHRRRAWASRPSSSGSEETAMTDTHPPDHRRRRDRDLDDRRPRQLHERLHAGLLPSPAAG